MTPYRRPYHKKGWCIAGYHSIDTTNTNVDPTCTINIKNPFILRNPMRLTRNCNCNRNQNCNSIDKLEFLIPRDIDSRGVDYVSPLVFFIAFLSLAFLCITLEVWFSLTSSILYLHLYFLVLSRGKVFLPFKYCTCFCLKSRTVRGSA